MNVEQEYQPFCCINWSNPFQAQEIMGLNLGQLSYLAATAEIIKSRTDE
jgi:hypothetical protein